MTLKYLKEYVVIKNIIVVCNCSIDVYDGREEINQSFGMSY